MARIVFGALADVPQFAQFVLLSHARLAAENLFLRKQLALYVERQVKPRRATNATRLTRVVLARFIEWRPILTIVRPDTLVRWHRHAFRLCGGWKSRRRGRPPIPPELQQLIADMARANRTWGEERIAAELWLKLGISLSPRTIRRYMRRSRPSHDGRRSQAWSTFVRNHAREVLACDFFVTVTATFRMFYVLVILDVGTRRIVHWNATEHPTADWTMQQFRSCVSGDGPHRFVIHDRDSIFSWELDRGLAAMGVRVLQTPAWTPQANAFCERLIGTMRRECLDFMIVLHDRHLRRILGEWVNHYNHGRPHASLGPGVPDPSRPIGIVKNSGRAIRAGYRVTARAVLGGLHHEYDLERVAA
jgi:putative transposase